MSRPEKKDATGKLKELVEDIEICMLVTGWGSTPFCAVPMATKNVDENGNIWFLSIAESEHDKNIAADEKVELLYSDPGKMEFLSISGKAKIHNDETILEELQNKETASWSTTDDETKPTAIEVVPENAHYWDTQTNKYETLYHLGIAALTKEDDEKDVEGDLRL